MFAYRVFEGALASAFGITEESLATFRSRLKYFRRLGLTGKSSNGGKNIRYSFDDLLMFGFFLELSEFGVDPQRMDQISFGIWPLVKNGLSINKHIEDNDLYFAALPVMLSAFIVERIRLSETSLAGLIGIERNSTRYIYYRSELSDLLGRRTILINFTLLQSRLKNAVRELEKGRSNVRS